MADLGMTHAFDPERVARFEKENYVAYYRRRWLDLLRASVSLVREAFGLGWLDSVHGAYLVARAEMAFAPVSDNDPGLAEQYMRRFYRLLNARRGTSIDVEAAARLDVGWWQVHRDHFADTDVEPLTLALTEWMSAVYDIAPERLLATARMRAAANLCSDRWVRAGMPEPSSLLVEEERALTLSYQALKTSVDASGGSGPTTDAGGGGLSGSLSLAVAESHSAESDLAR